MPVRSLMPMFRGAAVLLAFLPAPGWATLVDFTVEGGAIRGRVELPGDLAVDVELDFEEVIGLSVENLGLSARLVDAGELLGRLPAGVSLTGSIPVLIEIEPPAGSPLSFAGVYTLELHTHDLIYVTNCPLRLFKAPLGGVFEDITASMGAGSYRVRGTSGGFSQFLILVEGRLPTAVVDLKLATLEDLVEEHWEELPGAVAAEIQSLLDDAWAHYALGEYAAASLSVEDLGQAVLESSPPIPNVWRASRDLTNASGELRAAASTLRFSLALLASQAP